MAGRKTTWASGEGRRETRVVFPNPNQISPFTSNAAWIGCTMAKLEVWNKKAK
jgi:hypothetical protein